MNQEKKLNDGTLKTEKMSYEYKRMTRQGRIQSTTKTGPSGSMDGPGSS